MQPRLVEPGSAELYDYVVVNEALQRAHWQVTSILEAERARGKRGVEGIEAFVEWLLAR